MTDPSLLEIICMQQVESMRLLHERIRLLGLKTREMRKDHRDLGRKP